MKLEDLALMQYHDALTLLCGEYLGEGIGRQVYSCSINPDWVVKLQTDKERFQNQVEWRIWQSVREAKGIAMSFAPCLHISDNGIWMIQARTTPMTLEELKREKPRVQRFFTDLKTGNWGRYKGNIVCHDYGTSLVAEHGLTHLTKKADWYEG